MDYIPKTVKGEGRGWSENERGTKSQRGKEVRREWDGKGALGGLSLHTKCTLSRGPRVPVTPLAKPIPKSQMITIIY